MKFRPWKIGALVLVVVLLAGARMCSADVPTDTFALVDGIYCNPQNECSAGWEYLISDGTDGLAGGAPDQAMSIGGIYIGVSTSYDGTPGFQYASESSPFSETFAVDPVCDASHSIFVCDLAILGLNQNGVQTPLSSLPDYQQAQNFIASFSSDPPTADLSAQPFIAQTTAVPEPRAIVLLCASFLGLVALRHLA